MMNTTPTNFDKLIVTHPGSAHRDEFVSCCLLAAAGATGIERRDAGLTDLEDTNVCVLDQGGIHDPELSDLDHHQFERDAAPACSITLVLEYLGYDLALAREILPWLEYSEVLDSKGPFALADHLGCEPASVFAGISPVETFFLKQFEEVTSLDSLDGMFEGMKCLGQTILDQLNDTLERIKELPQLVELSVVGGVTVADVTAVSENPTLGLEIYLGSTGEDVPVTISHDDRGDGLSLFRRGDDPRVDFSKIDGEEGVVFAHNGGFIAKIEGGVDPLPLIEKALV